MSRPGGWIGGAVALLVAGTGAKDSNAARPVEPTTVGLNISSPVYYRRQRAFANLAIGSNWVSRLPGHEKLTLDDVDRDGGIKRLPGNGPLWRLLMLPNNHKRDAAIRCTYDGHGQIIPTMAAAQDIHLGQGSFTFHWRNGGYETSQVLLKVSAVDPTDPIRNLDCREADLPRGLLFNPEFLDFVRPFKIIRFMDWQNTNANLPVTWPGRHTARSIDVIGNDGVPVEDMVALVNEIGADPWFNMPWNADDEYIQQFARYVHDHVPPNRRIYVEAGNEVWNARFAMSKQALQEGQQKALSANPDQARLFRYAERTIEVMRIWTKVFADRSGQLVRVVNSQNGPSRASAIMGYKDLADHVDALATAPYFWFNVRKEPVANPDAAFARMNDAVDQALGMALKAKDVAAKYHKRYIAYEAGQGIVIADLDLAGQIQRDPRMYDVYARYLKTWRDQIGDAIVMYESVQPIVKSGAWGLVEYLGQPPAEAPKFRAVRDAMSPGQRGSDSGRAISH